MPGAAFFRNLGLFLIEDFLEADLCSRICAEMRSAAAEMGRIVSENGERRIDENVRRVMCATVQGPIEDSVKARLEAVRPRLQEHFGIALSANPHPEFLIYKEGAFYKPHADAVYDPNDPVHRRRVSVVVFLNRDSEKPAQDHYCGGRLTLHGIMKEPQWANCAFSLDPQPGLLIAFTSDLLHEVKPVTSGYRFSIVSWFLSA